MAANALASLVRGAAAHSRLGDPDLLATGARVAVWAFAIVVAVNQIGIAAALINTLFMAVVGAVALALGLAFGLGGRDTAAQVVRGWYARGQQAAPKMVQAVEAAQQQASSPASLARPTPGNNGAEPGAKQPMVVAPRQS